MGRPFAIAGRIRGWMGWDEEESDASALCGFFSGCLVRAHISRASSVQQLAAAVEEKPQTAPARVESLQPASGHWKRRGCARVLVSQGLLRRRGRRRRQLKCAAQVKAAAAETRCLFTSDPDQPRHTHHHHLRHPPGTTRTSQVTSSSSTVTGTPSPPMAAHR